MPKRRSRVELANVEHESIGAALATLGELYGVPQTAQLLHIPAVAAFLEALTAGQVVVDLTDRGHTRERAFSAAAATLGIAEDTLKSRVKAARRKAYGVR